MQGVLSGGEYLDIAEKGGRLMSLRISKRNRILKIHKTDCVSIADIYNPAKLWISLRNRKFTYCFYFLVR